MGISHLFAGIWAVPLVHALSGCQISELFIYNKIASGRQLPSEILGITQSWDLANSWT